jgi:hypothetical protein
VLWPKEDAKDDWHIRKLWLPTARADENRHFLLMILSALEIQLPGGVTAIHVTFLTTGMFCKWYGEVGGKVTEAVFSTSEIYLFHETCLMCNNATIN